MSWRDDLQSASWRGVPFVVQACTVKAGRNTALHAYPYREDAVIWVEDLGLAPRRMQFVGFLVGDDIASQQTAMLDAVETAGPGELVHPLLGSVNGSLIEFSSVLRQEKGRAIELVFDFVQVDGDASPYPAAQADTQGDVTAAAVPAKAAVGSDFLASLKSGVGDAQKAFREASAFGNQALSIARDAGSAVNAVRGVAGNFGRYFGGGGLPTGAQGAISTVQGALSAASSARASVTRAVGTLSSLVSGL